MRKPFEVEVLFSDLSRDRIEFDALSMDAALGVAVDIIKDGCTLRPETDESASPIGVEVNELVKRRAKR